MCVYVCVCVQYPDGDVHTLLVLLNCFLLEEALESKKEYFLRKCVRNVFSTFGIVIHYFSKMSVCVCAITGDTI